MGKEKTCHIEEIMDRARIPVSLQHQPNTSIIAFPKLIPEDNSRSLYLNTGYVTGGYLDSLGVGEIDAYYLKQVCRLCAQCQPEIKIRDTDIRIDRKGFNPEIEKGRPLYLCDDISSSDPDYLQIRAVFIDDKEDQIFVLKYMPVIQKRLITVNPKVFPSRMAIRQLISTISEYQPDVVVGDKGAGFLDMIDVFDSLKQLGIPTVMLTGEWQTDETKKVTDVFMTKPFDYESLSAGMLQAIASHRK